MNPAKTKAPVRGAAKSRKKKNSETWAAQHQSVRTALEHKHEIDFSISSDARPMTGLDLEAWRGRHALSVIDTSLALALPSAFHYNKLSRTEGALDLGMEILLRVYDEFPGAPAWRYPTIKQLFEAFYGPDRDAFFSVQGPEYSGYARSRLFTRFAAIFGRSMFSAHRWIERNGKVQADIARIQAKTVDMPDPRHDLERIAARVWALRGVDFETHFPRLGTELPANRRVRRTLDAKGVMKPSSVLVWSGDPAKKNRKKTLKNGTTDG